MIESVASLTTPPLDEKRFVAFLAVTILGRRNNGNANVNQVTNAVATARAIILEVENTSP